jgi:hypothetical protein
MHAGLWVAWGLLFAVALIAFKTLAPRTAAAEPGGNTPTGANSQPPKNTASAAVRGARVLNAISATANSSPQPIHPPACMYPP